MRRTALLFLFLVTCAVPVLAAEPPGWNAPAFERAQGRRTWQFPRDHGQHPQYRLEWWYYTGILRTPSGREFGFQVTFFRQGIAPASTAPARPPGDWHVQSLYLAHAALSDVQTRTFRHASRIGRDSLGTSGAAPDRLRVWVGPWRADPLAGDPHGARITVAAEDFDLQLTLRAEKPVVLHGRNGLDAKGPAPGQASWYATLPRLRTDGQVSVGGETFAVTGTAWMDHEFGTNQLGADQVGWDWFAIRLSDGHDLMLYRLRRKDGSADPASHGTLIDREGRGTPVVLTPADTLQPTRTWTSPASGGVYPVAWRIALPAQQLSLEVSPRFDAQELPASAGTPFAYWEGAIAVQGTHRGQPVTGEGYLELTGYAGGLRESFR